MPDTLKRIRLDPAGALKSLFRDIFGCRGLTPCRGSTRCQYRRRGQDRNVPPAV